MVRNKRDILISAGQNALLLSWNMSAYCLNRFLLLLTFLFIIKMWSLWKKDQVRPFVFSLDWPSKSEEEASTEGGGRFVSACPKVKKGHTRTRTCTHKQACFLNLSFCVYACFCCFSSTHTHANMQPPAEAHAGSILSQCNYSGLIPDHYSVWPFG